MGVDCEQKKVPWASTPGGEGPFEGVGAWSRSEQK